MSNTELLDAITEAKVSFKSDIKIHFGNVSCNVLETEERLNVNIAAIEKRVAQKVDELQESVDVWQSEFETKLERISSLIEESINKTSQRCEVLEEKVQLLHLECEANSQRIASLQVKVNQQRNLLLFNFDDQEDTVKELLEHVIQFFDRAVKVPVQQSDVEYVYRLGRKEELKNRPIMVAFFSVKLRNEILRSKGILKDSKVVIAEDFPKENNQIKKEVAAKGSVKTHNRKINIKSKRM